MFYFVLPGLERLLSPEEQGGLNLFSTYFTSETVVLAPGLSSACFMVWGFFVCLGYGDFVCLLGLWGFCLFVWGFLFRCVGFFVFFLSPQNPSRMPVRVAVPSCVF